MVFIFLFQVINSPLKLGAYNQLISFFITYFTTIFVEAHFGEAQ